MSHILQNNRFVLLFSICFLACSFSVYAQTVSFSAEAGVYSAPFSLTMTTPDASAVIRYTLNGTAPSVDAPIYTTSLSIADRSPEPATLSLIPTNIATNDEAWRPPRGTVFKATVIRAAAFVNGVAGPESFATYIVHPGSTTRYRIPVVSLITDAKNFFDPANGIYTPVNNNMWQSGDAWERPVLMQYFESDGHLVMSQGAGVRLHGNTTRSRPIKGLRLYARDAVPNGKREFDYPLFKSKDTQVYKRFLLRNAGNDWDQSYMRDGFQQTLITPFFPGVQHYRPVIVLLNGEYWGIHNLRDRYDDHYLNLAYGIPRSDVTILERNSGTNRYDVAEGVEGDQEHYNDLVRLASDSDPRDPVVMSQLAAGLDLDNYTDFYLSHIYFRNTDWPGNNVRLWRSKTGTEHAKWTWLVYDSDFGFDLQFPYVPGVNEGAQHNTLAFSLATNGPNWPNPPESTLLMRRLLLNTSFKTAFIDRYIALTHSSFAAPRVVHVLDSMASHLAPYIQEHSDRWGGFESVQEWESHIDRMRSFARQRPAAMRSHLRSHFFGGQADFPITFRMTNGGMLVGGRVTFTSETILYIPSAHPFTMTAVPAPGYRFVEWTGVPTSLKTNPVLRYQPIGAANIEAVFAVETSVDRRPESVERLELHGAYPNPFNPSTQIGFRISGAHMGTPVKLGIFDVLGREIADLVNDALPAGEYSVTFDATGLPSGVYIVRLRADGETLTRRITLLK
jgi:hypothetical protein